MSIRAEQKAITRSRILDAAATLVAAAGTDAASIDAIASTAGVTSGAIYASFRNKSELLLAVARERAVPLPDGRVADIAHEAAARLDELTSSGPVDSPLLLQLLAAAVRDPDLKSALADRMRHGLEALEQRLVDDGTPTALAPADTAALVQVVAAGLLALRPVLGDDFAEGLAARCADLLFRGA